MRLGDFDGFDGRAGAVVRGLLGEVTARLARASAELARHESLAVTLAHLQEAAGEGPDPVPTLEELLDELALALGAIGQVRGAQAATRALETARRLARALRVKSRELAADPALARDVSDLHAHRLPAGFDDLLAISTLLS